MEIAKTILLSDIYNGNDILLSINEKFRELMLNAIIFNKKIAISFEGLSLTGFFMKDFKKFVKDNDKVYQYVSFQKVNKFYKKDIFLKTEIND